MPPVIDTHVHLLALSQKNGALIGKKLRNSVLFRAFLRTSYGYNGDDEEFDRAYVAKLARKLRDSNTTDRVVLLALDGIYDTAGKLDETRTEAYIPNDYCRRVCDEHPTFLFGASVNPNRADAIDELVRVKSLGAVLIKWLPPSQDFDPAEKKYTAFYRKLADLGLPLLSHTGYEHCVPVTNPLYGDPELLVPALNEGVTVIAGHAGTSGRGHPVEFFGRYLEMLDRYPNLYGDLAAVTGLTRFSYIAEMLKRSGFMSRHLQATDYPAPPMPYLFPARVGLFHSVQLMLKRNIFDADVETKLALGFPKVILTNAAELLNINS